MLLCAVRNSGIGFHLDNAIQVCICFFVLFLKKGYRFESFAQNRF